MVLLSSRPLNSGGMLPARGFVTSSGRVKSTRLVSALLASAERSAEIRAVEESPSGRAAESSSCSPQGRQRQDNAHDESRNGDRGSNNGQTVVVDLDCVFGDVASVMGMVPEHTIGELAMLPSFDSTT